MRQLLLILLCGIGSTVSSQILFQKLPAESKNEFVKRTVFERIRPLTPPAIKVINVNIFKIISTPYKNNNDTAFLVVTKSDTIKLWNNVSTFDLSAYLYYPVEKNKYQIILMHGIPYLTDSRYFEPPILDDVFFANADQDKQKETIFLFHYSSTDTAVGVGKLYQTNIIDEPNEQVLKKGQSNWLTKFVPKLSGCDCMTSDGKKYYTKFKTAYAVKKELVRLGYK